MIGISAINWCFAVKTIHLSNERAKQKEIWVTKKRNECQKQKKFQNKFLFFFFNFMLLKLKFIQNFNLYSTDFFAITFCHPQTLGGFSSSSGITRPMTAMTALSTAVW